MNITKQNAVALFITAIAALMCLLAVPGCSDLSPVSAPVPVSGGDAAADNGTPTLPPETTGAIRQGAAAVVGGLDLVTPSYTGIIPKNQSRQSMYCIVVYKGSQSTVVYGRDNNGAYTRVVKTFTCSTGANNATWTGTYAIRAKYRWRYLVGGVYGQYSSSISEHYLFHSVPYYKMNPATLENEEYDKLGTPASKGCIRMCVRDCKWIYDNCPVGTEVYIVEESGPKGPGVPKRSHDAACDGWDPSDKWSENNPYFNRTIAAPVRDTDGEE